MADKLNHHPTHKEDCKFFFLNFYHESSLVVQSKTIKKKQNLITKMKRVIQFTIDAKCDLVTGGDKHIYTI